MKFTLNTFITIVLIISAINWGLLAYNNMDIVDKVTQGNTQYDKYIRYVIGLCGIYAGYQFVTKKVMNE